MPISEEKKNALIKRRLEKKALLEKYLDITNAVINGSSESAACQKYGVPIMTYRHFVDYSAEYSSNMNLQNEASDDSLLRAAEDRFIYDLLGPSGYARDDFWEAYEITTQKALSPREKQAVDLRYKEDYILDEIAEVLGVTRERSRQLVRKAIRKLTGYKYRIYFECGVKEAKAYEETQALMHDITEKRCEYAKKRQELEKYLSDITTCVDLQHVIQKSLKTGNITQSNFDTFVKLFSQYQQLEPPALPDTALPVEDMNLSPRAYNILKRAGINTLGDILKLSLAELQRLRWAGTKSCMEIVAKVEDFGYQLKA